MANPNTTIALDEYLSDFISSRYLCLERAVDEYIQAEQEIMVEGTSVADTFIDLAMDISDEEIDNMIDNDIDADIEEDEVYDSEFDDDDILNSDVDAMMDLEPEVNELDEEE